MAAATVSSNIALSAAPSASDSPMNVTSAIAIKNTTTHLLGELRGVRTRATFPVSRFFPIALKAKPEALLIEGANPRHEHEWELWKTIKLPQDKVLVPGVIGSNTNYVEHPDLVAQRIVRYAEIVGREHLIAGTDCGFGTFAGFGAVYPDITWLKLKSLADGAKIASQKLWGRAGSAN